MILNHLQSCYDQSSTNAHNKSMKKRSKNANLSTTPNKRNDGQQQTSDG